LHFVGLFFVFIIENARSKKQSPCSELLFSKQWYVFTELRGVGYNKIVISVHLTNKYTRILYRSLCEKEFTLQPKRKQFK